MPTVYRRAAARRDLIEHFVYLAENAGLDVAERFLASASIRPQVKWLYMLANSQLGHAAR